MITDTQQTTARIYQFPSRPRAMQRSPSVTGSRATERQMHQAPVCDFGSGWYHDAAIGNDPVVPHAG